MVDSVIGRLGARALSRAMLERKLEPGPAPVRHRHMVEQIVVATYWNHSHVKKYLAQVCQYVTVDTATL